MDAATQRLVANFELCRLPSFGHTDHVRVVWYYLQQAPLARVLLELPEKLRRFAASRGHAEHYHATITFAFTCLVHERIQEGRDRNWDEFAAAHQDLFDLGALSSYYPAEVLQSQRARKTFLLPRSATTQTRSPR